MAFDLEQAVREAPAGGVVSVPPGTHVVHLLIEKPLTLMGMGEVVLDGQRMGPIVRVRTSGVVKLGGLTLVGGRTNQAGGAVALLEGELELLQCTLRYNEAPVNGGGALYVRGKEARVSQCRFEGNTGRQGGAILVDETAKLVLRDCLVAQNAALEGGGLRVREGASAEVFGCTFADNKVVGEAPLGSSLSLSGTMTRAPSVSLSHCIVAERTRGPESLFNFPAYPGTLTLKKNLLPPWCSALGGDNLFAGPGWIEGGSEAYLLSSGSPAVGAGDPSAYPATAKDVLGRNRHLDGRPPDLGAFALGR